MTDLPEQTAVSSQPPLTPDDFRVAGFGRILAANPGADCQALRPLLWPGCRPWDGGPRRALELASDVASMMLVPERPTEIFSPYMQWSDGTCSMAPGHLSAGDIDVLAQLAGAVQNPALRARFADLVWFREKRRGAGFARMAIAAYCLEEVAPDSWYRSGAAAWHRALQLALEIRDEAEVDFIEKTLLAAFLAACEGVPDYTALHFLKPLRAERRSGGRAAEVAAQLARVGQRMLDDKRPFEGQAYHEAAADWFDWAREPERRAESLAQVAAALVMQSEQTDSAITQHVWLTKAMEAYRRVPGRYRALFGVEEAIEDVRRRREAAGRATIGEMVQLRGPRIDVTEVVRLAVDHVKDRPALDALLAFCGLDSPPDAPGLLAAAEQSLRDTPLSTLIGGAVLAGDGRQVENVGAALSWEEQIGARARWMFRNHAAEVALARILPARDQLRHEHQYRLGDFIAIAERSPVVPADRAVVVGKGLHAGFYGDQVQAMHILMPQFEHMVRVILQGAGAFTAQHREDGLDMEVALASLLDRPQMTEEFGAGLTLAIHAIMCDRGGSNLRNDVAHGLADEGVCESAFGVYAWWLILQLVVETFAASGDIAAPQGETEPPTTEIAESNGVPPEESDGAEH